MPQIIAGQENRFLMVVAVHGAVGLHVSDGAKILDLAFFAELNMTFFRLSQ